jgi:hypothetical protein
MIYINSHETRLTGYQRHGLAVFLKISYRSLTHFFAATGLMAIKVCLLPMIPFLNGRGTCTSCPPPFHCSPPGYSPAHCRPCLGENTAFFSLTSSVPDSNPNPDPPDPHVFGPPGSGPIGQRYGSGSGSESGSFYHQAKIVRKILIFSCFVTSFGLFILKKLCKCTFKK